MRVAELSLSVALMVNYFDLMRSYLGGQSISTGVLHVQRCLMESEQRLWRACPSKSAFVTLGVEGSGHQMIHLLDSSLCGNMGYNKTVMGIVGYIGCGGQESFPKGFVWRSRGAEPLEMPQCHNIEQAAPKYLVLLRDPVDTATSALGRFWDVEQHTVDNLARELRAHEQALCAMSKCSQSLPCERTLFLAYELLISFPEAHRLPLSRFLGVAASDPRLQTFLDIIRTPNAVSTRGVEWRRRHSIAPQPMPCTNVRYAQAARKLHIASKYAQVSLSAHQAHPAAKVDEKCGSAMECLYDWRHAWRSHVYNTNAQHCGFIRPNSSLSSEPCDHSG